MVDIHSHILPGVDDGADSWETAVEMCRVAAADGIEHMVATPHANDEYAYQRDSHAMLLVELQGRIGRRPALSLGCDFHFSYENVQQALQHPGRFCIADSRYLLVEFSDFSIAPQIADNLMQLLDAGTVPVITHPERNPILQRRPEMVLEWADRGCVVQVTASSLTGFWGKTALKTAQWLLKRDAVHVLASDAHSLNHRKPVLSPGRDAAAQLCGNDVADALVNANPRAIVSGRPLPYFPQPAMR